MSRVSRRLAAPALLFAVLVAINLAAMPGMFWIGDPFAWRTEARSLLVDGHLWVDSQFAQSIGEPGQYFVRNESDGRWYSKYGPVNTLMSIPPMLAERLATGSIAPPGAPPHLAIYNLYNILLTLLVCGVLYRLTGRYSRRPSTRVLYVLTVLYCTYLWYYQRAQSAEIYQVLFFLGFYVCLVRYLDAFRARDATSHRRAQWALGAWLFVLLLVLTRLVFGLLIAVVLAAVFLVWLRLDPADRWGKLRRDALLLGLPPVAILAILGWLQYVKFGSPLLTGYHVWRPEDHLLTGSLARGVWDLLFSPRFSLLLYFPPLAFALLGARSFYARHKADAIAVGLALAAFLLVFGKIPSWEDDWGYGMRYMLFLLPVAALPFLTVLDWLQDHIRQWNARALAVAVALALGYSALLNFQANRVDFFAYQYVRPAPVAMTQPVATYFYGQHLGAIYDDLISHRANLEELRYFKELRAIAPANSVDQYRREVEALIDRGNWYWK